MAPVNAPFSWPKSSLSSKPGGDGGAVQLDEGALAARAQAVNGARQQLLAGSGFALDEHGGVGGRHGLNLAQHVAQAGAFAHDVFKAVLEVDFIFEILLFLGEAIAQFGDLFKGQRVVDGHGHLAGYLGQHFGVVLRKCVLIAAGHGHRAQRCARDE